MGRAPPAAANPHPDGYRRLDLSLRERWARAESPGRSRAKIFALSKSGGSRTPGTGSQFLVDASVLASRAAVLDQGPPFLSAVGSPYRTWPVRAFGPHTGQTRRPSPDPLPASWRPRRNTGRSDQTGVVPNTQGTPQSALASRARGSRDPGRRRRSRPTLTTPRESVPRWTGRLTHRTVFQGCQGLISRKTVPSSRKLRSSNPGPSDARAHEDPGSRCRASGMTPGFGTSSARVLS